MRTVAIAVTLFLGLTTAAWTQTAAPARPARPMAPPRDTSRPTPAGTARIAGRVVVADTAAPLRRAQVRLVSPDMRFTRATTTDANGRYDFADLPAGRYTLSVSKAGYVTTQALAGAMEPGKPIELRDGQALEGLDVSVRRGGVITGRLTDEFGDPVPQAQMFASRSMYMPNGQRRQMNAAAATTDDLGQFRLYGLSPGDYIVSASVRAAMMMPFADASADSSPADGYAPTYYPGVLGAGEAQPLTVAAGDEVTAYFSLVTARLARVAGMVIDSQGRPLGGGSVMLMPAGSGMMMMGSPAAGPIRADGTFLILNVAPGDHTLQVRGQMRNPGEAEFASIPLAVTGQDITGLSIATSRGATISGRVIFDGSSPRTGQFTVMPASADPSIPYFGGPMSGPGGNGVVDAEGRFQLRGVFGKVTLRPNALSGWTLKSITLDGSDITDTPIELRGSETVAGVEIVLTDRLTDIAGTVAQRGQPVTDYTLLILPEHADTPAARFTRTTRPDQDGRFRVRGMPAGRYVAAALTGFEMGREWDPEFQDRVRAAARPFTLKDGESVVLDLELIQSP